MSKQVMWNNYRREGSYLDYKSECKKKGVTPIKPEEINELINYELACVGSKPDYKIEEM